ncbi:MAG: DUF4350 domain-containing protein, partial [Pseudonocardiaceae bacterium]
GPVAIVTLVVAVGIAVALLSGLGDGGALDPRSADPSGTRALARLLQGHDVDVELVHTAAAATSALAEGESTLLVTAPGRLVPEQLRPLRDRAAETVLIAPPAETLRTVAPGVRVGGKGAPEDLAPGCAFDAASKAGVATVGGIGYRTDQARAQCYPTAGGPSLVRLAADGRSVTLLGTGAPLTNAALDEQGNAALALRLLGMHQRLVWYVPSLDDPALRASEESLLDLLPSGWKFGLIQVAVAVGVIALWRGRRLGPVVVEALPVVVRAAETAEGRAQLYRKAGVTGHAAESLRSATRARLRKTSGLPPDAEAFAVVTAAAERSGQPQAAVRELLYGPAPTGDAALVRLADALDSLENEVHTR